MNFLAHLTLSYFSADLQVGNFLGDFVKGKGVKKLPPEIRRGVQFHRDIDALTDRHPAVRKLNASLRKRHGRYAGVISDIVFDYYLYQNWEAFGPTDFSGFCDRTYLNLRVARVSMPPRVVGYVDGMTRDHWLQLYTTREGMEAVFNRLLRRLSRPEKLVGIEETLVDLDEEFNRTFLALFPRLQQLANEYRE